MKRSISPLSCWCGNKDLLEFSPDYMRCSLCETLVSRELSRNWKPRVTDELTDFYGKEYWFSHQECELGLPNIVSRSRTDLTDRCTHWLRTLLKYKLPPAKSLELGSGHGGFVALLRWAGYKALGLELSPWIVHYSQRVFGVPVLQGPVEDQSIKHSSLDVIILMDVLEHLHNPTETAIHSLDLLKQSGLLVVQTPCYPEGVLYETLLSEKNRLLELLKPKEHLFIFSKSSIQRFFQTLGLLHLAFEEPYFGDYDMYIFTSRKPFLQSTPESIETALDRSPGGRMIQAYLGLDSKVRDLSVQNSQADADRKARWIALQKTEKALAESERDRAARLGVINAQGKEIERLHEKLYRWEGENKSLMLQIGQLTEQHSAYAEKLRQEESEKEGLQKRVESYARRLVELELVQNALNQNLKEKESENEALQKKVESHEKQLVELEAVRKTLNEEIGRLDSNLDVAMSALEAVSASRAYRLIHRLGRWAWFEKTRLQLNLQNNSKVSPKVVVVKQGFPKKPLHSTLRRIAVDMTPVRPGGENGGARQVATEIVRQISKLTPECEWILITTDKNHTEMENLEGENIHRLCVAETTKGRSEAVWRGLPLKTSVTKVLFRFLSPKMRTLLKSLYNSIVHGPVRTLPPSLENVDLLFCPFTAPLFRDPTVPVVSVVHDIQYLYYPQFFSAEERTERDKHFRAACEAAGKLICDSEYVRKTILANSGIEPERVTYIPIRIYDRLRPQSSESVRRCLTSLCLDEGKFLLFPSNFWQHKNHRMLLTAWGIYRAAHPGSPLKLVLTGASGVNEQALKHAAARMQLEETVLFAGYLSETDLTSLLQACKAIIFPSLYEGFGMPTLEAMAFDKPVICSNVTSLPEVVGDAALYFDPRKPMDIVQAIEKVSNDESLAKALVERGRRRLCVMGDSRKMAEEYLNVFHDVVGVGPKIVLGLSGVYPDGWTEREMTITFNSGIGSRYIEMILFVPPFHPYDSVSIFELEDNEKHKVAAISRGDSVSLHFTLPDHCGFFKLLVDPTFQPKAFKMNMDERLLGCVCKMCVLFSSKGQENLLQGAPI